MRVCVCMCVRACAEGKWAGDTETLEAKLSDHFFSPCVVFRRWCVESVLKDRHTQTHKRALIRNCSE